MLNVSWKYVLLTADSFSGHRVKRRMLAGNAPEVHSDGSYVGANWNASAPQSISVAPPGTQPKRYVFGFWSLRYLADKPTSFVPFFGTRDFPLTSEPTAMAIVEATAWYFWDFGEGPGDHGIFIDAFDVDQGDWLANDFVDVYPDPTGALTAQANDGFLSTAATIPAGQRLTITARDPRNGIFLKQGFLQWLEISTLTHTGDLAAGEPQVGGPVTPRDIVGHRGDIIVAIAFYNAALDVEWRKYDIPNPWWRRWVLRPPDDPRTSIPPTLLAALALVEVAAKVAPRLRGRVIELAVEQVSIDSSATQKDVTLPPQGSRKRRGK